MTYEQQGVIVLTITMFIGILIGYKWAKTDSLNDDTGKLEIDNREKINP